jgi:hypothetical protein
MSSRSTPPASRKKTYSASRLAVFTDPEASTTAVITKSPSAAAIGYRASSRAQIEKTM